MKIGKKVFPNRPFMQVEIQDGICKERFLRSQVQEGTGRIVPRFLDFHRLRVEEDMDYPLHQHRNFELILIVNGPYRCSLNGEQLRLNDGQVLMIQPGDAHQDFFKEGQLHYVVHFELEGDSSLKVFSSKTDSVNRIAQGEFSDEIGLLEEIAEESMSDRWLAGRIQDALLNTLFWRVIRGIDRKVIDREFLTLFERQVFLDDFHGLIQAQIGQTLKVADIAAQIGIPVRTLHQKICQLTGQSPSYWIRKKKIETAKTALLDQRKSIKEISYDLGYSNPFHFSQVFKQMTGMSPGRWRNAKSAM